jgi:hypothetical protein
MANAFDLRRRRATRKRAAVAARPSHRMFDSFSSLPLRDKVAIFVILATVLVGAPYVYATFERRPEPPAKRAPSLYSGLSLDAGLANAMFGTRIRARFPLSTPEDVLIRALEADGFRSDGWFGKRMTARRTDVGLRHGCDFSASVTWEADDQHRISTIDARFLRTPGRDDPIPE